MDRTMRQSTIGQADTCQKRIEFMLQDPPYSGGVNRAIGTSYHAGLAEHYLGVMHGEPASREAILEAAVAAFDEEVEKTGEDRFSWQFQPASYRAQEIILDRSQALLMVETNLDRYFAEGHNWDAVRPDAQVVAVEMSFDQDWPQVPGWRRSGTIDLVLKFSQVYALVDHKTAKKKWSKDKGRPTNPQFAWYIEAWSQHAGVDPRNITCFYDVMGLQDGSFERRQVFRTPHQVELTLDRAAGLAKLIDQGGPFLPNPESFLCSKAYCDFWAECPFGAGLKFDESDAA